MQVKVCWCIAQLQLQALGSLGTHATDSNHIWCTVAAQLAFPDTALLPHLTILPSARFTGHHFLSTGLLPLKSSSNHVPAAAAGCRAAPARCARPAQGRPLPRLSTATRGSCHSCPAKLRAWLHIHRYVRFSSRQHRQRRHRDSSGACGSSSRGRGRSRSRVWWIAAEIPAGRGKKAARACAGAAPAPTSAA